MKPATKYTKSGDVNIAYQVFGSGAIDLVYIPGWISNIDLMWACPELVYFLQELGKIARVILFDKRGTGLSDRVVDFATLEERMDDIRAVMDAVGSEKAVLFGHSEGGSVSALFAATYPNRTISLIAFGIFAKRIYSPNYPWAPTNEERQEVYDMIENNWGSGEMNLESLAPSKADDPVFMSWLANYFRSGASPSAAMTLTKMNTQVDIIDILSSIKVPSLIMQRTNDIDVKVEEGRFIADRIEDAKFIELAGSDHLFWTGNTNEVLQEMKAFILNVKPKPIYEKQLFTIIVGHFVSMKNNINHQNYVDQLVKKYGGNIIQNSTRTFTVIFKAPSNAILCSHDLVGEMAGLDLKLNIWMHIKECYADHVMSTDTEGKVVSVLQELKSNQILLTQTLKNLLIGVELNFSYYKTVIDPESNESNESIELYAVSKMEKQKELPNADKILPAETISFMEAVMQAIHANLDNECFGVEMLCKKIGMSERKLQRRLKAITQKPPRQLISSIRLHRAKELIASTNYTISEIAFRTGFTNPSYFSKAFKKEFRMSPSDLKK